MNKEAQCNVPSRNHDIRRRDRLLFSVSFDLDASHLAGVHLKAHGFGRKTQLHTGLLGLVRKETRQIARGNLGGRSTATNRARRDVHIGVQPVDLGARARLARGVERELVRLCKRMSKKK